MSWLGMFSSMLTWWQWALLLAVPPAIVLLYFFLKDLRSTLLIAVSIPVSIVATIFVMYQLGISHVAEGNYGAAIKALTAYIEMFPEDESVPDAKTLIEELSLNKDWGLS